MSMLRDPLQFSLSASAQAGTLRPGTGEDVAGLSPQDIQLVRASWRILCRLDPQLLGEVFYGRLFQLAPGVRRLFPKDMHEQRAKLVAMLNHMVVRIEDPAGLRTLMHSLGKNHVGYGAKPSHYSVVGQAMLWTFEKALGTDWTPETSLAWQHLYELVAGWMLEG